MLIVKLLALIDLHTLLVLFFSDYMSTIYILAGATFPMMKGLFFYLTSRDVLSFLDIIVGIIMLFIVIGDLWNFIWWTLVIYETYKIILSFFFT